MTVNECGLLSLLVFVLWIKGKVYKGTTFMNLSLVEGKIL